MFIPIYFNHEIRHMVQHYVSHMGFRIPMRFKLKTAEDKTIPDFTAILPQAKSEKAITRKRGRRQYLYSDGIFGGAVLNGNLILQDDEEQILNHHTHETLNQADSFKPERIADLEKLLSPTEEITPYPSADSPLNSQPIE